MRRYFGRILTCTVPVLIGLAIIGWAGRQYSKGEGGFRLGVDLVGGTILVYEVDLSKVQGGKSNYKADEMTTALKRRVDPNDLLNVTIRSLPGDPPRVEVILPTGGRHQSEIEDKAWSDLREEVTKAYPPPEGKTYNSVGTLRTVELKDKIKQYHPYAEIKNQDEIGGFAGSAALAAFRPRTDDTTLQAFIDANYHGPKGVRGLTHERIEEIKGLISQQGRLEFRILANSNDDAEAMQLAREYFSKESNQSDIKTRARNDEPPPGPTRSDNEPFTVTLGGETTRHRYSWVEIGKTELYSEHLETDAVEHAKTAAATSTDPLMRERIPRIEAEVARIAADRARGVPTDNYGTLIYSREMPPEARARLPAKDADKKYQYFFLTRDAELIRNPSGSWTPKEITGKYLIGAASGPDYKSGGPAVHFTFDTEGGNLFWELTSRNKPTGSGEGGFQRRLAIVLDGLIQSAPSLNEPIRTQGQISGNFTQPEVDNLVKILRAGALPATLRDKPVSENTMGATLGADTIRSGTMSIFIAFAAILLFMAIYYRFAGLVACFALLANLILTVAFMVVVDAAFTLPGLAGLVLMLGMAVDANVLIYERLREERERGANLAMAIRNGYDRAFPTIIDTHLTSIFTAVVLYVVGNDQLKGFGISLTAGLIISLFTSLYVTRTIFDIWLGMGWLKNLTMMHLFRRPNFDFMGIRYYWFAATVIITIFGGTIFLLRLDNGGLNIDFMGGTSYTGRLERMLTNDELQKQTANLDLPDKSVQLEYSSDPTLSSGNRSKLFNVRTAAGTHGDTQAVLKEINKNLENDHTGTPGEEGKRLLTSVAFVYMPVPADDPEGKRLAAENKWGMRLIFYKPDVTGTENHDLAKADKLNDSTRDFASVYRVRAMLVDAFKAAKLENSFKLDPLMDDNHPPEGERYSAMQFETDKGVTEQTLVSILDSVKNEFGLQPQPDRLEVFNGQLARDTQRQALIAILASWIAILVYLWFRFGSWTFGAAAVVCLIHDLFFTLGGIALAHYLHGTFIGNILGLQDFKVGLTEVAALLTLVGYSVSDTIVVFDRIREVRGKNPALTPQMINDSVNQTLSRTLLSSLSVWLVVIVLYWLGGQGVHLFAYVMVIGVVVGTYSSIYIASPLLLIFGEGQSAKARAAVQQQEAAAKV